MYSDDPSYPDDDGGENVLIIPLGEKSMRYPGHLPSTAAPIRAGATTASIRTVTMRCGHTDRDVAASPTTDLKPHIVTKNSDYFFS